jgi:exopolysaccharide production protein ExoZ
VYKSLQAGRAIAAMLVVLFHLGGNLAKDKYFGIPALHVPFSFGSAGVEFFFVLSGFIILTAHHLDIGQPSRLGEYLRKRLLRIFPTYWLVFLPVFLVALAVPSMRAGVPHDVSTIIQSLLLIPQDIAAVEGTGAPVIIVAWSLQYEMLFYLFFALLIANARLAGLASACIVGFYSVGLVMGADALPFPLSFAGQDYVLLFAMGMLVAWAVARDRPAVQSKFNLAIGAGLSLFLVVALDVVLQTGVFEKFRTLLYGVAASAIVLGLVTAENNGKVYLGHRWLQVLGDASYAIYLIHFPLISVLCKIAIAMHLQRWGLVGAALSFVVIFVACLSVGVLFHIWLERPIAAYFRRQKVV